jgi:hypothetical protein
MENPVVANVPLSAANRQFDVRGYHVSHFVSCTTTPRLAMTEPDVTCYGMAIAIFAHETMR